MKHTKGPWFVSEFGSHRTLVRASNPTTGRKITSTFVSQPNMKTDEAYKASIAENTANAKLIAAAPDLIAQLDMVVGDLVMLRRAIELGDPRTEIFFRIDDTLRDTCGAIAKATA